MFLFAFYYQSCSAFAPICNPIKCQWGQKAFTNYLGVDENAWKEYDSCELVRSLTDSQKNQLNPILIDQGSSDGSLKDQLLPENFVSAAKEKGVKVDYRLQEGYGHSYFFVSTFVEDHIQFHASYLS